MQNSRPSGLQHHGSFSLKNLHFFYFVFQNSFAKLPGLLQQLNTFPQEVVICTSFDLVARKTLRFFMTYAVATVAKH
jgi:hypothetical protein